MDSDANDYFSEYSEDDESDVSPNQSTSAQLQLTQYHSKIDIHVEKYVPKKNDTILNNNVSENKIFVCHFCSKIFLRRKQITKHLKNHEKEKYFCTHCNRGYVLNSSLRNHMRSHSDILDDPAICKVCGQLFAYKSGLKTHMKIHLNIRNHICKYCSRSFIDSSTLRKHLDTHENVRYKCEICGKEYSARQTLKSHLAKHLGLETKKTPEPLRCSWCPLFFSSKHLLVVHTNTEHLNRIFECDICRKTFASVSNLNVHRKIHTMKYSCHVCEMKYNSREGIQVHMNKHLGVKFPCPICVKVYYLDRHLTDHILKKHNC